MGFTKVTRGGGSREKKIQKRKNKRKVREEK